jgi:hypothetical protein
VLSTLDADHVFQVLVEQTSAATPSQALRCRCALTGRIEAVTNLQKNAGGVIVAATTQVNPTPRAVVFIPNPSAVLNQVMNSGGEFWVLLRCEFVLDDGNPRRAVDGEFIRGELPTGDRLQGGLFESWFRVVQG